MRRYLGTHGRAPLAVAGFLAFPLFFASLMASSLKFDRPSVTRLVSAAGKVTVKYGQTPSSVEAKIWVAALIPPAILLVIGLVAMLWHRTGIYIVCGASVLLAYLVTIRLDVWAKAHALRFPTGFDLVPDSDPSNLLLRGEWEGNARETAISLGHWTMGIAVGIAAITGTLALRRQLVRGRPAAPADG